jgi:hypothetical protein
MLYVIFVSHSNHSTHSSKDCCLCSRHIWCLAHPRRTDAHQPTQAVHNWMARVMPQHGGASPPLPCLPHVTYSMSSQAVMTGGTILKITIDPTMGGATIVEGGIPFVILCSGYIGSSLFGGLFILAGWDTLVAKVMSFVLGLGLVTPLVLVRDKL